MSLAAVTAALALASPFGELPFQEVRGGAACLSPTGTPAELARWTPDGAELLAAGPGGLVPTSRVDLGKIASCPVVATAGAAGVAAGMARDGLRVVLRRPGGGWDPVLRIRAEDVERFDVAVSPRGDAVVAWAGSSSGGESGLRVLRAGPGGTFGAPEAIGGSVEDISEVRVGIAAAGEAVLVFTTDRTKANVARATTARPGTAFAAARTLGAVSGFGGGIALAVAPDGRALVAVGGSDALAVHERSPGGAFLPAAAVEGEFNAAAAIGLRPDGGAVVAAAGAFGGDIAILTRSGPGLFRPAVRTPVHEAPHASDGVLAAVFIGGDRPSDRPEAVRAVVGPDGSALVAWGTEHGAGVRFATVADGRLTGSGALGSVIRDPGGVTPLQLPDGTRALAWTDDVEFSPYSGRLRVALEGRAAVTSPSPPKVTVLAPRDRTLRPAQGLRLPIRCSAACDLRGTLGAQDFVASLTRAGTAMLHFWPRWDPIAPPAPGPIRIAVKWGAPGAHQAERQTFSVRLRRLPAPPLPRILNLRATRRGSTVDVRWNTDVRALDAYIYVAGSRGRDPEKDARSVIEQATDQRRRSFHVRLRDAARVRFVVVYVYQAPDGRERQATVRVAE